MIGDGTTTSVDDLAAAGQMTRSAPSRIASKCRSKPCAKDPGGVVESRYTSEEFGSLRAPMTAAKVVPSSRIIRHTGGVM